MNEKLLMGIDIGTSSIKTVLVDLSGKKLAQSLFSYKTNQPHPGYVEQDADETWWRGACDGIRACLSASGADPSRIAGICASGMVPNLCPLDSDGKPVRPAILYRDNRAITQAERLKQRFGWDFSLQDVVPKLLWIKENEPEAYSRIRMVLNSHSYIAFKLTGKYSTDTDVAAIFGNVYDCEKNRWQTERMEQMGLDPDMLPPLYRPTGVVGEVTKEAARITGLSAGIPVIAGTGDSFTILVGTGTVRANEGLIYLGTAGTFLGLKSSLDDAKDKCVFITGDALFLGNVLTGGEITRWYKECMLPGTSIDYAALEAMAADIPLGADGLYALPHLMGERTPKLNPNSKGVLFGLTTAHTAAHVYRALLEGVAYAFRDSYEHNYLPLKRLVITGGGSNCVLWREIIANVLGHEIECVPNGDNALGTAFLAGLGLGLFPKYDVIRDEWLTQKQVITPDAEKMKQYDDCYAFYKRLNDVIMPLCNERGKQTAPGQTI